MWIAQANSGGAIFVGGERGGGGGWRKVHVVLLREALRGAR